MIIELPIDNALYLPCLAVKSCGSFKYNPLSPLPQDFHHHPPFNIDAQFKLDLSLSLRKKKL